MTGESEKLEIALDRIRQKYGPDKISGAALIRKEINNGPSPSTTPGLKGAHRDYPNAALSQRAPCAVFNIDAQPKDMIGIALMNRIDLHPGYEEDSRAPARADVLTHFQWYYGR